MNTTQHNTEAVFTNSIYRAHPLINKNGGGEMIIITRCQLPDGIGVLVSSLAPAGPPLHVHWWRNGREHDRRRRRGPHLIDP